MILSSCLNGFRRLAAAPAVLVGILFCTLAAAAPLAVTLRDSMQAHLGRSLMAGEAANALNYEWWTEFAAAQGSSLGSTLTPAILGFAPTLDSLSGVLDARTRIAPVTMAIGIYLLAWLVLSAGIIDRYARQRPTRAYGFLAICGGFLFRFVRLGAAAALAYGLLFAYVHPWLFTTLTNRVTRDLTSERSAFFWRMGLYLVFGALLITLNVVFDYAKIRTVVEDRRSAIGSIRAACGFIGRNLPRVVGLYATNMALFLVVIAAWAMVAPGAGGAGPWMWVAVIATQLYVLARLILKLQFIASQTALFQASLAHARYTRLAEPVWPESAAVENLEVRT
jgi:hypothetical protein